MQIGMIHVMLRRTTKRGIEIGSVTNVLDGKRPPRVFGTDTRCGAKLFRVTPRLAQVLQRPFLSRWIFDVEPIARFLQLHAGDEQVSGLIYGFPLHCWKDIPGSKLRPRDFYDIPHIWSEFRDISSSAAGDIGVNLHVENRKSGLRNSCAANSLRRRAE